VRRFAAWLATEGELPAGPLARRALQPLGYDGLYRSLAKGACGGGSCPRTPKEPLREARRRPLAVPWGTWGDSCGVVWTTNLGPVICAHFVINTVPIS
jgi:hypothetical protein